AVPAADHGPDLRLRGGQRRGAGARSVVAAELDAQDARGAPLEPYVRAGAAVVPLAGKPQDPRLPARVRRGRRARGGPVRGQPLALGTTGRTEPVAVPRARVGRDDRANAVPPDRRSALSADAGGARLLLVPPGARRRCAVLARRAPGP